MLTRRSWAVLAVVMFALAGCGAKTGLEVPDARPVDDAAVDMPMDAPLPCVEIPWDPMSPLPVEVPISTEIQLERADVLFLIDVTSSMNGEIGRVRSRLRDVIAPAIEAEIPDVRLGVSTFADFPQDPFGTEIDFPYRMLVPMSNDLSVVQAAMNSIGTRLGGDEAEAQVEALYQSATGEGLGDWIPASFGCPNGGFGYPCFRDDSLSLVFLFTDAPFHNGPEGDDPYFGLFPSPHSFAQSIAVLNSNDIRVIGFASGGVAARRALEAVAVQTNARDGRGNPLVYDIGTDGENLDDSVVRAIQDFADGVIFDIDAVLFDVDPADGVDSRAFVSELIPSRASPMDGIEMIDAANARFVGVRAGTTVYFQIVLRNDVVAPTDQPQEFFVDVQFRGNGRTTLRRTRLRVVVPPINGHVCGADGGIDAALTVEPVIAG